MGVQAGHRVRVAVGALAAALVAALLAIAPATAAVASAAAPRCVASTGHCSHHERHASAPPVSKVGRHVADRTGADGLLTTPASITAPTVSQATANAAGRAPEQDSMTAASRGPPTGELPD